MLNAHHLLRVIRRSNLDHLPLLCVVNLVQDILDEPPSFRVTPYGVALLVEPLQGLDYNLCMGDRNRPPIPKCFPELFYELRGSFQSLLVEEALGVYCCFGHDDHPLPGSQAIWAFPICNLMLFTVTPYPIFVKPGVLTHYILDCRVPLGVL